MRTLKIELAGQVVECSLSWQVMKEITDQIADPMVIAQEVQRQIDADAAGTSYDPKVSLSIDACVRMIAISADLEADDVGEMFMEHGVLEAQAKAGELLAHLLGAGEEKKTRGKNKPLAKKKKPAR